MSDPAIGPPSTPEVPNVAVVIPVRDGEATLADAVASVLAQELDGTLEVCIAVGPSNDRTREVADGLADADRRVSVVDNPAGVTPAGLNAAIRATSAPVVARVDGHAVLPADYLARAVAVLDRTGAVNVGGVQEPHGQTPFEEAVGRAMASRFGSGDARFHYGGPEGEVDTVYLGVFQRTALEAVGLFDEVLVRNQDYELNWRLREAGGTVWFDPDLRVSYRPRGTLGALARQFFEYGQWKRVVVGRHPRSLRWRQVVPPAATLGVAVGLVAGIWWLPALVAPLGYLAAVVSASLVAGRRPATMLRLLAVYPTLHLSWGVGFLTGPPRGVGRRAAGQDAS
ncbi:MAG: glycosyl transferase family 2 [Acidimicrobiaceae bacterium]|nr:glycosyl transferase family 2 [Acidimicrobiaceae bacterium]